VRAAAVLSLDARTDYDQGALRIAGIDWQPRNHSRLRLFATKYSSHPDLGRHYLRRLTQCRTLTLLYNANVVELVLDDQCHQLRHARLRSPNGRESLVSARHFVLAGGTIETARLLLASNRQRASGLGNGSDCVGRYFQDHIATVIGSVTPPHRAAFHHIYDPFYVYGVKHQPRIKLMPAAAAEHRTLHASLQFSIAQDPYSPLAQAKSLGKALLRRQLSSESLRHAMAALRAPPEIARFLWRRTIAHRGTLSRTGTIGLECHCEQEPLRDSRVSLAQTHDALGMPRVRLDWQVSDLTLHTLQTMANLAREDFAGTALGRVSIADWVAQGAKDWRDHCGDVFHQCGTTRMSTDERHGVVNTDCQVFGVHNLYVASCAVFPTSSFSNPTLTMMALTVRLIDHLVARLRAGQ
jgi:choline dehydrogenase-like flavoprotein